MRPTPAGSIRPSAIASQGLHAAALVGLLAVAGCSGSLVRWPGAGTAKPEATTAATVYYSAVEGLAVLSQPRASAPVQGRLSLHEKVYRDRIDQGYAHVRAEGDRLVGWVDNAKLIWRLPGPATSTPAQQAPPPVPSAAPTTTTSEAPGTSTSPPAAAPPPSPDKGALTPSIFDPY